MSRPPSPPPSLAPVDPVGLRAAEDLAGSPPRLEDEARASLVLEDGAVFAGRMARGCLPVAGEAVFTTAMGGYPESMTDPSYRGQILVFTYPEIGIYGVDPSHLESGGIYASLLVVHRACRRPSLLPGYIPFLEAAGRAGRGVLEDVDTRALARHLRVQGTMRGALVAGHPSASEARAIVAGASPLPPRPMAAGLEVDAGDAPLRIALVDFGVKEGIRDALSKLGAAVEVFDPRRGPEALLAGRPDGVVLSNGPGDPALLDDEVGFVQGILGKVPVLGVCLGHQLLGRALGATTEKLRFGHRGVNHPVRDLLRDRTFLTSQNHGYALSREVEALPGVRITHVHAGDGSVEGIEAPGVRARSVQFHPEARPGPVDTAFVFEDFLATLRAPAALAEDAAS